MSTRTIAITATFVITAFARSSAQTTPRDTIAAFYRTWSAATVAEGPAGYARHFAQSGTVFPPNERPVVGRDSIREWQDRTRRNATHDTRPESIRQDEITISGDLATVVTVLRGQRIPKAGGDPTPFEARYLDVLQRSASGWEFRYRMWTSGPP
jgi:ketosteroid isomerase-like protein